MQNHKVYSISKPVIHHKLLQALLQPLPPAQTLYHRRWNSKENCRCGYSAVDDNPANLKLIVALLHDLVQEVYSCQNGHQAVAQAERNRCESGVLWMCRCRSWTVFKPAELIHPGYL